MKTNNTSSLFKIRALIRESELEPAYERCCHEVSVVLVIWEGVYGGKLFSLLPSSTCISEEDMSDENQNHPILEDPNSTRRLACHCNLTARECALMGYIGDLVLEVRKRSTIKELYFGIPSSRRVFAAEMLFTSKGKVLRPLSGLREVS